MTCRHLIYIMSEQKLERDRFENRAAIDKILVRATNWLGDAVMTLPALGHLRRTFPDSFICLMSQPSLASFFQASRLVDEILIYRRKERGWPEFLSALHRIRQTKFDLAVLFQGSFEAALIARLAGIPIRVGYAVQSRSWLLTHPIAKPELSTPRHQTLDYAQIVDVALNAFGRNNDHPPLDQHSHLVPVITPTTAQREAGTQLLREHDVLTSEHPIAMLNAGATNSRAKRWPVDRYAGLADALTTSFGARIVFLGTPTEREIAERVIQAMKVPNAVNLAGLTDIPTLVGLLSHADLVIGNDTGSAHVAAALGRPTLTIFGPTNEFETAPSGQRSEIVRAEGIECARCMFRDCPIDHRCMIRISTSELVERARPFLT